MMKFNKDVCFSPWIIDNGLMYARVSKFAMRFTQNYESIFALDAAAPKSENSPY